MTLAEMREELKDWIQYDGDFREDMPDARYHRLINLAYVEACRVCELPEEVRSFAVGVGQRRVGMPIVKAYRAWWGEVPLRREVRVWARLTALGAPESFEQVGRALVLYPMPSEAGTLLVEGVWEPALLVDDADEPILPSVAHRGIVKLALAYYLDTLGVSKRELRVVYEREARALFEEVLRELRASRWGESRWDARYPVSFWVMDDE